MDGSPAPHWSDGYYGALYLEPIADLLTPRLTALETEVITGLLRLGPDDRVLDLACGHGRTARALAGRVASVVGLERSGEYLARAAAGTPPGPRAPAWLRADLRALPLRAGAFDAAYSWYASLFMFDDAQNAACLAALARAVRPGGRALVHHANPLRLARQPRDASRQHPAGWLDGGGDLRVRRVDRRGPLPPAAGPPLRRGVGGHTRKLRYYRLDENVDTWPPGDCILHPGCDDS